MKMYLSSNASPSAMDLDADEEVQNIGIASSCSSPSSSCGENTREEKTPSPTSVTAAIPESMKIDVSRMMDDEADQPASKRFKITTEINSEI